MSERRLSDTDYPTEHFKAIALEDFFSKGTESFHAVLLIQGPMCKPQAIVKEQQEDRHE